MLSSGLRKVIKALLILLAAAWIATDANATSEGERAPGLADKRFVSTYLYAAVRPPPPTMPSRSSSPRSMPTPSMYSSIASPRASRRTTHAIVLLDQAGWHGEKALAVPVGGAIHSVKSVHILPLLHELSRTHGCNRMITL